MRSHCSAIRFFFLCLVLTPANAALRGRVEKNEIAKTEDERLLSIASQSKPMIQHISGTTTTQTTQKHQVMGMGNIQGMAGSYGMMGGNTMQGMAGGGNNHPAIMATATTPSVNHAVQKASANSISNQRVSGGCDGTTHPHFCMKSSPKQTMNGHVTPQVYGAQVAAISDKNMNWH